MRLECDGSSSVIVTVNRTLHVGGNTDRRDDVPDEPAPVFPPRRARRARRTAHATAQNNPIRLSSSQRQDDVLELSHPRVSRQQQDAQPSTPVAPPVATRSLRGGKNTRSSTVSHKTLAEGVEQLSLFAALTVENERVAGIVADVATPERTGDTLEDEIATLRGYLSSRLDERGLPRDDTALLDSCGVDTARLLRMARRLAALEEELRRRQ